MTIRARARGLVDGYTGAVLAVTGQGISWLRPDTSRVDVTPDFMWGPVANGGDAVAVAGSERVQWTGSDAQVRTAQAPAQAVYRLAVAGPAVAAVSQSGQLTCWRSLDAEPQSALLDFEPDGLAIEPTASRIAVWGWYASGTAVMTVLAWDADSLSVVDPRAPWPAPESGVAFGLTGGVMGVGGSDSVVVLSATGDVLGTADMPGLERVTGSPAGVAWIRSPREDQSVVGLGHVPGTEGAALRKIAELPVRITDPFPEFAPVPTGELLLVAGVGPHELALHRLSRDGWAEPITVALPTRAGRT